MGIERTGVLLVNLGTPEEPTPGAVRRFLREFLLDPRVVQIPRVLWWPLLNFVVLPLRASKVAKKYESIWMPDGSPLRVYTGRQAQMLKGYLGERLKAALPVVAAMRYGEPSIAAGLAELKARDCKRVLVLPLYPQYSASTTASIEDAIAKATRKGGPRRIEVVQDFHDKMPYVKAIVKNINDYWMKHGRPDHLVLSFHGLPKAMIDAGDPYKTQCHTTARLIATELGWNDARTIIAFQSRFGKAEWIGPATDAVLARLGSEKVNRVDVACPGFASDCLETLEEISIEGRKVFRDAGGKEFHYIPTTNDTPAWMTALTEIALENLALLYKK